MIYSIPQELIEKQLLNQLESNFLLTEDEKNIIHSSIEEALKECETCFLNISNKYYYKVVNGVKKAIFNPYHSVQYMSFLYFLSNIIYKKGQSPLLCDKLYYLNKILNSVDILYAVELPKFFHAEHPIGTVLGRAKYGNGFVFLQGCTVGGTHDKEGRPCYPVIEENVHMYANSAILGRCHIGKNVNIGAGCIVKNQDVPDNCTVFGESPNLIIKKR